MVIMVPGVYVFVIARDYTMMMIAMRVHMCSNDIKWLCSKCKYDKHHKDQDVHQEDDDHR